MSVSQSDGRTGRGCRSWPPSRSPALPVSLAWGQFTGSWSCRAEKLFVGQSVGWSVSLQVCGDVELSSLSRTYVGQSVGRLVSLQVCGDGKPRNSLLRTSVSQSVGRTVSLQVCGHV